MPSSPITQNPPAPAPPTTIEEAKAAGIAVAPGVALVAPLSPKSGPIAGEAGTFVVTVVKAFWDSPTIKAIRAAVLTALGLALLVFATQIISSNGNLSNVNWDTTEKAAIAAAAFSLASAYAAWWKRKDNDPVK